MEFTHFGIHEDLHNVTNNEIIWIYGSTSFRSVNKLDQTDIDCESMNGFKNKLEKIRNKR